MNSKKYKTIVEHYEKCLELHGDSHLGVDWPNKEDALKRYQIMLNLIMTKNNQEIKILDFGCGAGHLLEHIKRERISGIDYTGLDFSEKYIDLCKSKFPNVSFINSDILENKNSLDSYDYIIMNGVFTEKRELSFNEMYVYFKEIISVLWDKCNMGMAFNVMSKHVDWERHDLFHLPFDTLAEFLRQEISNHFIFRNDYGLYEYTCYVYKSPDIWQV